MGDHLRSYEGNWIWVGGVAANVPAFVDVSHVTTRQLAIAGNNLRAALLAAHLMETTMGNIGRDHVDSYEGNWTEVGNVAENVDAIPDVSAATTEDVALFFNDLRGSLVLAHLMEDDAS